MRIAIATPTGHIGSKVAELLQEAGSHLVLLVRDARKVAHFLRRGAEAREGRVEDAEYLKDATRGVDALFWVTPPSYAEKDYREFMRTCGRAAAGAIRANKIARVVNLSSAGAHLEFGAGPINGLHDVERLLNDAASNITHLRPGFFFENYLWQLDGIRRTESVYMTTSGNRRVPMIATRDIADAAARRLLDASWTGRSIRGLHGPANISYDEAAQWISDALGHPVHHVKVPEEAAREAMIGMGMSPNAADMMLEMYRGVENGTLRPAEPRTAETTTPTTFKTFVAEVLVPALGEPVHA